MSKGRHAGKGHVAPEFTPSEWEGIREAVLDPDSMVCRLLNMTTWQRCELAMEIMNGSN